MAELRVGVYLADTAPLLGGAHTFESELRRSILEVVQETRHEWTFVAEAPRPPSDIEDARADYLSLQRGPLRRALHGLTRRLHRALPRVPDRHDAFVVGRLLDRGIDLLWNLTPDSPTLELPFIATIWDVQHRLQPYFPEVSAGGTWDDRERHFGRLLPRAAAIITGTEAGRDEIHRFFQVPLGRIKVIPQPTPRFALSAASRAASGDGLHVLKKHELSPGFVLYPAQFWPHKNHVAVLQALHLLGDPALRVVFVGSDRGNAPYIRRRARELGLADRVRMLGFVPTDELAALYAHAHALAFMTFFGPDNLPPLEAFAIGCPVIASQVPGAEEQLGDAALLVDPRDPAQLATALRRLRDEPGLREELVRRGRDRAARHTGRDFVRRAISVIDELEPIRRCWDSHTLVGDGWVVSRRPDIAGA